MKYILYSLIIIYTTIEVMINEDSSFIPQFVIIILILLILLTIKERFFNNFFYSSVLYIFLGVSIYYQSLLIGLLAIIVYDIVYNKYYPLLIFISLYIIYLNHDHFYLNKLFLYLIIGIISYVLKDKEEKKEYYIKLLDKERGVSYEYEKTKRQLLHNNKEIERLTQIKERNRIARNIHDNIGHDIAGVLFQLQAADKVFSITPEKSREIMEVCINKLGNSLDLIRETVYNIKPNQELNENIFKQVIEKFVYCPISFDLNGSLYNLSSLIIEVLVTNLKEALTNASKHSGATKIDVKVDITTTYVRFYYSDNGKGCIDIQDGLGISGMKERIKSLQGMININGHNGFTIITVIPTQDNNILNRWC